MYNVDQQLFEYCTAKFADNTQCCVPVIDVKHELPLCMEHGVKAVSNRSTCIPLFKRCLNIPVILLIFFFFPFTDQ